MAEEWKQEKTSTEAQEQNHPGKNHLPYLNSYLTLRSITRKINRYCIRILKYISTLKTEG